MCRQCEHGVDGSHSEDGIARRRSRTGCALHSAPSAVPPHALTPPPSLPRPQDVGIRFPLLAPFLSLSPFFFFFCLSLFKRKPEP
eukprot:2641438-Rhodomonas_salina.1